MGSLIEKDGVFPVRLYEHNKNGSALILVLWVIGLLAMLVASFAFEAHIESRLTSFYRDRTKAEYLARSGLDLAEVLLRMKTDLKGTAYNETKATENRWYKHAWQLAEGSTVEFVQDFAELKGGEGVIRFRMGALDYAKLNVNKLIDQNPENDETWERILDVAMVPEDMWPTLIDSFYDWTDPDDEPRPDGAETRDYYERLDKPDKVANGPLETIGEMMRIKGFTAAVFHGGTIEFEGNPLTIVGIKHMLDIYGAEKKVNINAASRDVLRILPDVGQQDPLADEILAYQGNWIDPSGNERSGFRDVGEFLSIFPDFPQAARSWLVTESSIFEASFVGEIHGVQRKIECKFRYENDRMVILEWREDD